MANFVSVGTKDKFPLNRTTAVDANGKQICIAHAAGETFYAFDNMCTHAYAELADVDIEENNEITCPLHGARFSIQDGRALTLPAVKALQTYEVKVEGNDVLVNI